MLIATLQTIKTATDEYNIERLEPRIVAANFERAIRNSVFESFPSSDVQLCFFHPRQSLYRPRQSLGPQRVHNDSKNSMVRDFCLMIASLAYVLVGDIKTEALVASAPAIPNIQEMMSYFSHTYFSLQCATGRNRAVLLTNAPVLWNLYTSIFEVIAATNNANEGWRKRFAEMLGCWRVFAHKWLWKRVRWHRNRNHGATKGMNNQDCVKKEVGGSAKPCANVRAKLRDLQCSACFGVPAID